MCVCMYILMLFHGPPGTGKVDRYTYIEIDVYKYVCMHVYFDALPRSSRHRKGR